jgi:hypothetical protein
MSTNLISIEAALLLLHGLEMKLDEMKENLLNAGVQVDQRTNQVVSLQKKLEESAKDLVRYEYLKSIGPTEFRGIYGEVLAGADFSACVDQRIEQAKREDAAVRESFNEKAT